MAGEIEEPFTLDFRVDSFHSGSISFGRFESEALCWERRSSFSHNRYLEEVEKCSKPGSVTEKKAYFEAHFRKRRFPVLSSPESLNETDHQISENDISKKKCNDEELDNMNASTCSAQFDESLDGSVHGLDNEVTACETDVFRPQFELANNNTGNVDCIHQHVNVDKVDDAEFGSSLSINSESGIEIKENLDGETAELIVSHESNVAIGLFPDSYANEEIFNVSPKDQLSLSPKDKIPSKSEHINPRVVPRVSVGQSRKHISRNTSKGLENRAANDNVRNVPVRSKAQKKNSEDPKKSLMQRTKKYERGSKTKGVEINSAEKEPRCKVHLEPHSSTSQAVSNGAYQSANRVKPATGVTKPGTRQDISGLVFKSDEYAQRRKKSDNKFESKNQAKEAQMHQIQSKNQGKTHAEMKQLRKSISFKAMPMRSFYREALCAQDGNKAIHGNIEPRKQHAKSSIPGVRLSVRSQFSTKAEIDQATPTSARRKTDDPPEVSGVTSCHSNSSTSSFTRTSKDKPSQAGISRKKEAEKEKLTSLSKHKVYEGNQIHKGKTIDGKQRTRIGKSPYSSFNSSSRAGHVAVGVAS